MKFVTTYRNLDVILQPVRQILSQDHYIVETIPALTARFRNNVFESKKPEIIQKMLELIDRRDDEGKPQTFGVHPGDKKREVLFRNTKMKGTKSKNSTMAKTLSDESAKNKKKELDEQDVKLQQKLNKT